MIENDGVSIFGENEIEKALEKTGEISIVNPDAKKPEFLVPFLNQAIARNDLQKVIHYLELGAPAEGVRHVDTRKHFDYDSQKHVETNHILYDDKIPSPIVVAAEFASVEITRTLITNGAVTGHRFMPDKHNPALTAITNDRHDILGELMKHGVCFSFDDADDVLINPLDKSPTWLCAKNLSYKTLKFLSKLPTLGEDIFKKRNDVPISVYALRCGSINTDASEMKIIKTLDVLFAAGVSPNDSDRSGGGLLHNAAERWGNERYLHERFRDFCLRLVERKCDPRAKDDKGRIFLDFAGSMTQSEKMSFLSMLDAHRLQFGHGDGKQRKNIKAV